MDEYTGNDTAGATCGGCDDGASGSIFLAYSQRIGIDASAALQVLLISQCLDVIGRCLSGKVERSGKCTFMFDAVLTLCCITFHTSCR